MRSSRGSGRSVRVRQAEFSDYAPIGALLSRYALEVKSYDEWRHLWIGNPVYKDVDGPWPMGWVLETGDQRVVGCLGNIPLRYEFQGQSLIAAASHAWVVDSEYRSYAPLLLDCYFAQRNVDLYLSTTVNAQASSAFTAFNSLRVPVGAWDRSRFWIGNYRGFAASWAATKALPMARPLSYLLAAPLWSKDRSARRALDAIGDSPEIEYCDRFDERFDEFWKALSGQQAGMLLAVRTREALNWHFMHALRQRKAWLLTLTKESVLSAYCIFLRQDNPVFGLKRMRVVDFQVLDGNTAVLLPMLARAMVKCRAENIHMLEYVGVHGNVEKTVDSLAPLERTLPSWPFYYRANSRALAHSLNNAEAWNPSPFDGDSSL